MVYFEEHLNSHRTEERQVFQDEWSNQEFNRLPDRKAVHGMAARSYENFCLYHTHEWMRSGVSP